MTRLPPLNDQFTVMVAGEEHQVNVAELVDQLKIDPVDPRQDMAEQPALFAWVATLAAQAEYDAGRAKQDLVTVRAAVAHELRQSNAGKDRSSGRLTEAAIEDLTTLDQPVEELTAHHAELARRAAILVALREAFRQRRVMLQALAYGMRAEIEEAE